MRTLPLTWGKAVVLPGTPVFSTSYYITGYTCHDYGRKSDQTSKFEIQNLTNRQSISRVGTADGVDAHYVAKVCGNTK